MGKHRGSGRAKRTGRFLPFIGRYRKFIIAATQAALVAFFSVMTNGVSPEEWGYIILSVGAALGVFATPNKPNTTTKDKNDNV